MVSNIVWHFLKDDLFLVSIITETYLLIYLLYMTPKITSKLLLIYNIILVPQISIKLLFKNQFFIIIFDVFSVRLRKNPE